MTLRAPAKLNLCLYLGGRRDDGLHELCSLFEPLSLADRIVVAEAEADEVVCAGGRGHQPRRAGARRAAGARLGAAAAADRDREADTRRRGARRRQRRRRGGAAAGRRGGGGDRRSSRPSWAPTCRRSSTRASRCSLGAGRARWSSVPRPGEFALRPYCPIRGALHCGRLRRGGPARARAPGGGACGRATLRSAGRPPRAASPLDYADLLVNDLEHAALSLRPAIREAIEALRDAGAEAALVTGSGPTAFGLFADLAAADAPRRRCRPARRTRSSALRRRSCERHGCRSAEAARRPAGADPAHRGGCDRRATSWSRRCCRRSTCRRSSTTSPRSWVTGRTSSSGFSPSSRPGRSSASSLPARRSSSSAARSPGRARPTSSSCSRSSGSRPGLGDTASFFLGRRLGREFILRHGRRVRITPRLVSSRSRATSSATAARRS